MNLAYNLTQVNILTDFFTPGVSNSSGVTVFLRGRILARKAKFIRNAEDVRHCKMLHPSSDGHVNQSSDAIKIVL